MTRHLGDSGWDARGELTAAIKDGTKDGFTRLVDKILRYAESAPERSRVEEGRDYIKNNWKPAKIRLHSP
jgi:hypothetical protein